MPTLQVSDDEALVVDSSSGEPQPGIYRELPFAAYVAWPHVNNSSLGSILKSPAHYKHRQAEPLPDSDAFAFGRLLHQSCVEPQLLTSLYAVQPDLTEGIDSPRPKSTKEYKQRVAQFHELAGDKEIVDAEWFHDTQCMLRAIYQNPQANSYLAHQGPAEVSVVWDEPTTGIRCKARFDKWDPQRRILVDLKTTRDATDFERSIGQFGYHRQAAFYCDAAEHVTGQPHRFAIIAVEKTAPYAVRAALLDEDSVAAGRRQYRRALRLLQRCWDTDEWPGPENPEVWRAPTWACDPVELLRNGEVIHEY